MWFPVRVKNKKSLLSLFIFTVCLCGMDNGAGSQPQSNDSPSSSSGLSAEELAIWNDPGFKQQFTQSYLPVTEIEPQVTANEQKNLLEIANLISADQLEQASLKLQDELNEASSAVFDFMLANLYFQQEQWEQAEPYYRSAVDKFPKFRRAWKNIGLVYVRQNDFAKALPAFTKVIELGGVDAITYGLLAFAYSSTEHFIEAESAYRMAIMLDPITLDWKLGLARSFFKQYRYAEAASLCGQLLESFPNRIDLWLLQANAYIGMNKPLEAAKNYEIVDRLGGSTIESLYMLGDIYVNEELYSIAVQAYIRAVRLTSDSPIERAIRSARILAVRGAPQETKQLLNAIENQFQNRLHNEDRKSLLKLRARLAVAEETGEEEVRVLKEIVELDPLDGEALLLLGQYYSRKGEVEQAGFYYERAANIEGFEADAKVRHAQLLVSTGKYAEAIPLLRRAQTLKPRENVQEYLEQIERIVRKG